MNCSKGTSSPRRALARSTSWKTDIWRWRTAWCAAYSHACRNSTAARRSPTLETGSSCSRLPTCTCTARSTRCWGSAWTYRCSTWLSQYAFPLEARFADTGFAREVYPALAKALVDNGTTRVCMFSSLHTDATLVLMEALEQAGITGYVGKVNMDRNGGENLQETTEESQRETLRWLDACDGFRHIRPMLTPRFTPACTDALLAWLGALSRERPPARAIAPVGKPGGDGARAIAAPRLRTILGDLRKIRPVSRARHPRALRAQRRAGARRAA